MDRDQLLALLEQVQEQSGDWRVALEQAIYMVEELEEEEGEPEGPDLSDKFTIRDNPNQAMDQQFEHEEVKNLLLQDKITANQVWTVVEGDDGRLYALTGFHIVNKLYYAITEEPWTEEDEEIDYHW